DAGDVEAVAPAVRLADEDHEVGPDGSHRVGRGAEADELAVPPVAPGPPGEHRLGEQALPPAGDEALAVEVARVQGPEPHHASRSPSRTAQRSQGGATAQFTASVRKARRNRRRSCAAPTRLRADTPTTSVRSSRTLRWGPSAKARSRSSWSSASSSWTWARTSCQVLRRSAMHDPHSGWWPRAAWHSP